MTTIQKRRGTAAQWTTSNPILAAGEDGYETDTGRQKTGNGVDHWVDLEYILGQEGVQLEIATVVGDLDNLNTTNKTNVVAAINEAAQTGGGDTVIGDANETTKGLAQTATLPDVAAGTDHTNKYVTPAGLKPLIDNLQAEVDLRQTTAVTGSPAEGFTSIAGWIADIQSRIDSGAPGPAGKNGAEYVTFGDPLETTPLVQGTVWGPWMNPVDIDLLEASAIFRGGNPASGPSTLDWETSTSRNGVYTSVFTNPADKLIVPAGSDNDVSGPPSTPILAAKSWSRIKAISVSGSGGAGTWRGVASLGNGSTVLVNTMTFPVPAGAVSGDWMDAVLFIGAASVPNWPVDASNNPLFSVDSVTMGLDTTGGGPFYMYHGRKQLTDADIAGTNPGDRTVTFGGGTGAVATAAVWVTAGYTYVPPTTANFVAQGTASTSILTPSGLITPKDNTLLVHVATPRWTSGNNPSVETWLAPLTTTPDTQAQTARSAAQNVGIAIAHETQATAGAVTARSATTTVASRSLGVTFMYTQSSSPLGAQVEIAFRRRS